MSRITEDMRALQKSRLDTADGADKWAAELEGQAAALRAEAKDLREYAAQLGASVQILEERVG